jgi:broad-specificity NMP kinase
VRLVLVSGISGSGKTSVCAALRERGHVAVEADWEGYCHWVDRSTGAVVTDPPYPVPPGWIKRFGWLIDSERLQSLAEASTASIAFVCGHAENAEDVAPLFDRIVCLVIDEDTLRHRLATRTNNAFGKNPDELEVAVHRNAEVVAELQALGAVTIDAVRPLHEVVDDVLAAVASDSAP